MAAEVPQTIHTTSACRRHNRGAKKDGVLPALLSVIEPYIAAEGDIAILPLEQRANRNMLDGPVGIQIGSIR